MGNRTRKIAEILGRANHSAGKMSADTVDVSFENITDTGTEGTKVASGTTGQRGSTAGQLRFNTTTGLAEYYTGTAFKSIDAPPTISSIDVTEVDSQAGGNQTIVITGSGFNSGATVTFVGASGTDFNASSTTRDSDTQITAVAPKSSFLNAQEPYGVKVINVSGLSATLASQINVDTSPSWNTASGSLGSVEENASASFSVSATDPDGDTVSYSETGGTVLTTNNLSLNSSTGAITGTAPTVSGDTTLSFTLRATANSKNADRAFSIIVANNPVPQSNLVYDFRANDFSGSAGTLSNGTNLDSCLATRGVYTSNEFNTQVEYTSVVYTTSDTYAPNGKAFILNGSGLLEINPANTTIANSYFNLVPSCSWVMWVDWDNADTREGFFSRYGSVTNIHNSGSIAHFNHMFDNTGQFHYNQSGPNLASGNLANGTWQVTSGGSQWQLIIITYDHTTGIQTWYIDGSSYATVNMGTNSGSGMSAYSGNLTCHALGGRTDNVQMMNGKIAEARFYTRTLTSSEVSAEWSGTKANYSRT